MTRPDQYVHCPLPRKVCSESLDITDQFTHIIRSIIRESCKETLSCKDSFIGQWARGVRGRIDQCNVARQLCIVLRIILDMFPDLYPNQPSKLSERELMCPVPTPPCMCRLSSSEKGVVTT